MNDCNQLQMPIFEALLHHIKDNPVPMHVPGHKMGRGFPNALGKWLESALKLDVTELPGLDDLHNPTGPIRLAQQLAAQAFLADYTFFLVNGSTSGNYAMIFSTCKPGDTLIVARNFHKSIIQACALRNIHLVFIEPPLDLLSQSAGPIAVDQVKQAIQKYPGAKAVLLTSPTYQGIFSPISEIANVVHSAGMLLLVDEAHGAHLAFHPQLRKHAALLQGADIVVQSTHKMLGSLTQTAMLHVKGNNVNIERLKKYVSICQSSSPSYIFLASLDAARNFMSLEGEQNIQAGLERLQFIHTQSQQWRYIDIVPLREDRDPFKVVLRFKRGNPEDAEQWLRLHHRLYFEMVTPAHLLAVTSFADTWSMAERFVAAIAEYDQWLDSARLLPNSFETANLKGYAPDCISCISEPEVSFQELEESDWEWVDINCSQGRIAYHLVAPYPPGIPVICPGERINQKMIDRILKCLEQQGNVQGLGGEHTRQLAVCLNL